MGDDLLIRLFILVAGLLTVALIGMAVALIVCGAVLRKVMSGDTGGRWEVREVAPQWLDAALASGEWEPFAAYRHPAGDTMFQLRRWVLPVEPGDEDGGRLANQEG